MSMVYTGTSGRSHGQASPGVRLATLSDEALLWELGLLHAARSAGNETDTDAEQIVELEGEYLRRHPLPEQVR